MSGTSNFEPSGNGPDFQETVTLLQGEIARLEQELQLRDRERDAALEEASLTSLNDRSEERSLRETTVQLREELDDSRQTINFLLDQIRAMEESERASRAEWDALCQWVEQVEQRVEAQGLNSEDQSDLIRQSDEHRRRADQLQEQLAQHDHTAKSRQLALQREIEQLRSLLEEQRSLAQQVQTHHEEANPEALAELVSLRSEVQALRQHCHELSEAAAVAAQIEPLRRENQAIRQELEQAAERIRLAEDTQNQIRIASEHAQAALRARMTDEVNRARCQAEEQYRTRRTATEIDERIRAFRQHLDEVHRSEEQERVGTKLSERLVKLWSHTRPSA